GPEVYDLLGRAGIALCIPIGLHSAPDRNTEGDARASQEIVDLRPLPARVPELDDPVKIRDQLPDELLEQRQVEAQGRGELQEDGAEPGTEQLGALQELIEQRPDLTEPPQVRDGPTRLDGEPEPGRDRVAPPLDGGGRGEPVKRVVQLDGREPGRVPGKLVARRQAFRIEYSVS